jgi:hypothetical protein
MGLRYPTELITRLLEGVQTMKESTTYQAILQEGRIEGKIAVTVQSPFWHQLCENGPDDR